MNKWWAKWGLGASLAGLGLVLLDALVLEKYFFQVKKFRIGNTNGTKKITFLLVTDLHFKYRFWPFHTKLARKINALSPDLLLITGDTFNEYGSTYPVKKFFSLLHPHLKKAAILGNHDHKTETSLRKIKKIYKEFHFNLLINESKVYILQNERVVITGLDDFIESSSNFEAAVSQIAREKHHLLLIHSPLQQETVLKKLEKINASRPPDKQLNIQYIFAGHNHGGQIRLFNYTPVLPLQSGNYVNGWYNDKPPYLYVSKGFGTSAIPMRFMAPSEIVLFEYYI